MQLLPFSDYARPRLQNYLRPMPLEKIPVEIEFLKLDFLFSGIFVNWFSSLFMNMPPKWKSSFKDSISTGILSARLRLQNYLRPMTLEKFLVEIEFLKLDFLFSGIFVNWSASLFKNMPPKWKSSFKDLIFIGFFFFFLQLLLQQ